MGSKAGAEESPMFKGVKLGQEVIAPPGRRPVLLQPIGGWHLGLSCTL